MICAIVLAAGRSTRMGTQKLLLPLGHKPMITRIVDELRASPLERIFVVIGRDGTRIPRALRGRDVTLVRNADPQGDMLSSVRCGLRALPPTCEAVLVALGDQPAVTSELIGWLIDAFRNSGRSLIVPTFDGHRGHPILFGIGFLAEVLTDHNEVGLRGLLHSHPEEIFELEASSRAILEDIDGPEDYARQQARLAWGFGKAKLAPDAPV